ncbi:Thi73p [Sugiyamaella lignohabitans]|uniref:Thi73p n=1 Tax=Sugiyamaella lignohabitans TaxID=796027 RepID=A0A167CDK7_9ASCO|nr:Thi73p [Sugiyamaella lignohabitans]ANB11553.1 Thi73p [Sugiyamaella lignohabitans]
MLPNSPVDNKIFTEREKQIIIFRLKDNLTGIETKVFKWSQVKEVFFDPKTYFFFLISFFGNIPNGGLSNFGTLIIQGFGFSTLVTTLMQIPNGAVISGSILLAVFLNNRFKNRRVLFAVLFIIPNIVGAFGLYFIHDSHRIGRLICYYLTGPYNAAFVLLLSVTTANTAGHTKKVMTNAILFMGVCVGNIAGPFFYKTDQAPKYPLGMGSLIFSNISEAVLIAVLGLHLYRQNKKRDRDYPAQELDHDGTGAFLDLTDIQNKNFRYIY